MIEVGRPLNRLQKCVRTLQNTVAQAVPCAEQEEGWLRLGLDARGFRGVGGAAGPRLRRGDHQSRCFPLLRLDLGDRIVD